MLGGLDARDTSEKTMHALCTAVLDLAHTACSLGIAVQWTEMTRVLVCHTVTCDRVCHTRGHTQYEASRAVGL
jgi:hypothetical protein